MPLPFCIGMLLRLDQGSMTIWQTDELLGVMQTEGLSGPLCVSLEHWFYCIHVQTGARIQSAPSPHPVCTSA